jgi:hypothetical protein
MAQNCQDKKGRLLMENISGHLYNDHTANASVNVYEKLLLDTMLLSVPHKVNKEAMKWK